MKKIFISYSTPINPEQQYFLNKIKNILLDLGIEYVTVENIKDVNPFYKIKEEINNCKAFICLAFVKYRRGILNKHYYTSAWLDVELSLAFQKDLDYYIFCDNKIENTCILSKAYNAPKINYVNDWKMILDNFEEMNSFLEWIKSI